MSRVILIAGRLFALGMLLLLPTLHFNGVTPEQAQHWAQEQGGKLAHAWIRQP